jgi:transposase
LAPGKTSTDDSDAIDETVLDEGCFYLTKQGMTPKEVAVRFEISASQVAERAKRFEKSLKDGKVP